jgi:hypothetical protein
MHTGEGEREDCGGGQVHNCGAGFRNRGTIMCAIAQYFLMKRSQSISHPSSLHLCVQVPHVVDVLDTISEGSERKSILSGGDGSEAPFAGPNSPLAVRDFIDDPTQPLVSFSNEAISTASTPGSSTAEKHVNARERERGDETELAPAGEREKHREMPALEEDSYFAPNCCERCMAPFVSLWEFLLEKEETRVPQLYGSRIIFRRLFLINGFWALCYNTFDWLKVLKVPVKDQLIQLFADLGIQFTWPEGHTVFDVALHEYSAARWREFYITCCALVCVTGMLVCDMYIRNRKGLYYGRYLGFLGALLLMGASIVPALPNYTAAMQLDTICPYCAPQFNNMVLTTIEQSVGLMLGGIFTVELFPLLLSTPLALVRTATIMLETTFARKAGETVHPRLPTADPLKQQLLNRNNNPSSFRRKGSALDVLGPALDADRGEHRLSRSTLMINSNNEGTLRFIIVFATLVSPLILALPLIFASQILSDHWAELFTFCFFFTPSIAAAFMVSAESNAQLFPAYMAWILLYLGSILALGLDAMIQYNVQSQVVTQLKEFDTYSTIFAEVCLGNVVVSDLIYHMFEFEHL